jgi:hypothetical protein
METDMPTKHPALNLWTAMLGVPVTITTPQGAVTITSRTVTDFEGIHGPYYFVEPVGDTRVKSDQFGRIAKAWTYAVTELAKLRPDWPPSPEQIVGFRSL